ncbi:MAG TPA: MFS transporter [Dehalococcoidia bacterium]|nr:MFS transporter [Dehalococcoidia bacterium]
MNVATSTTSSVRQWMILLVTAGSQGLAVMGVMLLTPALPRIAVDFNTSVSQVQWVVISYGLTQTALVPLAGRISDLIDRRNAFLGGLAILAAGSVLGNRAVSIEMLIFARVIQAVGAASLVTNTFAIVTDVFPPEKRGGALGVVVVMIGVGVASGFILGGYLVTQFDWQATFLAMILLACVLFIVGLLVLPRGLRARRREPLDWSGALLLATGLVALLLAVTQGQSWGWISPRVLLLAASAPILFITFVLVERAKTHPLIDLNLFKDPIFAANNLAGSFGFVSLGAFVFLMPFYLQGPQGFSAQETGLILLPLPAGNVIGAIITGRVSTRRMGSPIMMSVGLISITVGFLLISAVDSSTSVPDILWRATIAGFGVGTFQTSNSHMVMSAVSAQNRGSASGVLNMFQQIGTNVGIALSGVILSVVVSNQFEGLGGSSNVTPRHFAQFSSQPQQLYDLTQAFMNGFALALVVTAAFAVIAVLLSWLGLIAQRARLHKEPLVKV